MNNIAVLDFGSARLKLSIATFEDDNVTYVAFKDETYLSSHVDESGNVDLEYYHSHFIPKVISFLNVAREHSCTLAISIGTHVFRELANREVALGELESYIGKLNIISGEVEGRLFYYRVKGLIKEDDFILLDIGGGSVQIVDRSVAFSIPTGTFSLEKMFQSSKEFATEKEIGKMREFINENLSSMPNVVGRGIVFGSSCMRDFVVSCFRALGVGGTVDMSAFASVRLYQDLFNKIK